MPLHAALGARSAGSKTPLLRPIGALFSTVGESGVGGGGCSTLQRRGSFSVELPVLSRGLHFYGYLSHCHVRRSILAIIKLSRGDATFHLTSLGRHVNLNEPQSAKSRELSSRSARSLLVPSVLPALFVFSVSPPVPRWGAAPAVVVSISRPRSAAPFISVTRPRRSDQTASDASH